MTVPLGQFGHNRPIEIVDERWESPELKMLIESRYSDPRTGVIEYRLTNIRRAEPSPELFEVPADYSAGVFTGDNPWITLEHEQPNEAKGAPAGRPR